MKRVYKSFLAGVCCLLIALTFAGCKKGHNSETNSAIDAVQNETAKVTESEKQTEESEIEATILENEGDVVIVVPDDQEAGGE